MFCKLVLKKLYFALDFFKNLVLGAQHTKGCEHQELNFWKNMK